CIGRADRGREVGKDNAAFEKIQVSVELELPMVKEPPGESGQMHVPMPKHALIGKIVNSEEGSSERKTSTLPVQLLEVNRYQSALPVIDVEDVGLPLHSSQALQDGPTKENETLAVIRIVRSRAIGLCFLVKSPAKPRIIAFEIIRLLHQVDGHFAIGH